MVYKLGLTTKSSTYRDTLSPFSAISLCVM